MLPFFHRAWLEVLDQDVGAFQQAQQHGAACRFADVERDGALVAIDSDVVAGVILVKRRPQSRTSSPCGGSTLITSAPWSDRIIVQYGPPRTRVRSMTFRPASAPGDLARPLPWVAGWRVASSIGLSAPWLGGNSARQMGLCQTRQSLRVPHRPTWPTRPDEPAVPVMAGLVVPAMTVKVTAKRTGLKRSDAGIPIPLSGVPRKKPGFGPVVMAGLGPRHPRLPLFAHHKTWMAGPRPSPGHASPAVTTGARPRFHPGRVGRRPVDLAMTGFKDPASTPRPPDTGCRRSAPAQGPSRGSISRARPPHAGRVGRYRRTPRQWPPPAGRHAVPVRHTAHRSRQTGAGRRNSVASFACLIPMTRCTGRSVHVPNVRPTPHRLPGCGRHPAIAPSPAANRGQPAMQPLQPRWPFRGRYRRHPRQPRNASRRWRCPRCLAGTARQRWRGRRQHR